MWNKYGETLDYLPDGECQLLNVITGEEEPGALCEIEIDWLVTVLNWYGELTGKHVEAENPKELRVFIYHIDKFERNASDEEILKYWENSNGNNMEIMCYTPNELLD